MVIVILRLNMLLLVSSINYGYTASLFKYLQQYTKLRLMESDNVTMVYTVAILFRNLYVSCYGSQTTQYFGINLPEEFPNFLEKYINGEDW